MSDFVFRISVEQEGPQFEVNPESGMHEKTDRVTLIVPWSSEIFKTQLRADHPMLKQPRTDHFWNISCDNSRQRANARGGLTAVLVWLLISFLVLFLCGCVVAFQVTQENPTKPTEP